ncbi:MAG: rhomboid family intramembrane serine protease [Bdellovibrionota bacterium]
MIIPFFNGLMSPMRAPMTWIIIFINLFILVLTQINMSDIQNRLEDLAENEELSQIQGRIFASYILDNSNRYPSSYQKIAEEALSNSDHEKTGLLGALALRDSFFYSDSNAFLTTDKTVSGTDSVEKAWWKEKSKEVLLIRHAHAGYALGITEESRSPLQWLTYQFVHSDEMHFFANMIVFLIFGAALESVIGALGLLMVFVISGLGAALVYLVIDDVSAIPLIGASGAVSGVVALFCVLFWNHGLRNFYFLFVPARGYMGFVYVPGWLVLLLWIIADLAGFLSTPGELGGVAHSAHLGGELCGLIMAFGFMIYFKWNKKSWREKTEMNTQSRMLGATLKIESI